MLSESIPMQQDRAAKPAAPGPVARPARPAPDAPSARERLARRFLLPALLLALLPLFAPAQYQLDQWTNFEDGKLPADAFPIGRNFASRAGVVEYAKIPSPPAGLTDPVALRELGNYGFAFKAERGSPKGGSLIGLAIGTVLARAELGEKGRALFQADFFIPAGSPRPPQAAVLALAPLKGATPSIRQFYRFGFATSKMIYFSYIPEAEPRDFKANTTLLQVLPRGAWHRLAIVCEGPRHIRCYIDGIEMSFSPVEQGDLQDLQVGVCLAEESDTYTFYVDNLSIQHAEDDAPLPVSPWISSWPAEYIAKAGVPNSAATLDDRPSAASASGPAAVRWLDTTTGWAESSSTGRPMLVAFLAPGVRPCERFLQLVRGNPAASAYFSHVVPIRIDVNQLQGGDLARKFRVLKLPTLLLLDSRGNVLSKVLVAPTDDWSTIETKLKDGAGAAAR